MIKMLKNKKGATLIELLVGILLFALIAAMTTAVLSPMMLAFSRANSLAEYNMLLDNIGNRIISDMAMAQASSIRFSGDADAGADEELPANALTMVINSVKVTYSIDEAGFLLRNGRMVLPEDFYRGKIISGFSVDTEDSPYFEVHITISTEGGRGASGAVITRTYAVRPLLA